MLKNLSKKVPILGLVPMLTLGVVPNAQAANAVFSNMPENTPAIACYSRHYDAAHLKKHPKQNVTEMTMLIVSAPPQDGMTERMQTVTMDVKFRKLAKPFRASGGCSDSKDGSAGLQCGIECDGGHIGIRVKNEQSLLIDIPSGASVYDPSQPLDADPGEGVPKNARFGIDDKVFRLDQADNSECMALAGDAETKAAIAAGQ